jgi:hypothetical protein
VSHTKVLLLNRNNKYGIIINKRENIKYNKIYKKVEHVFYYYYYYFKN